MLFNQAAERIFGLQKSEALGSSLDRFIPARCRAAHRDHIQRFGEARVTVRRIGAQVVLSSLRANGQEFPIEASISHVTVEGHKFYTVILRDVSERQRAGEALRRSHQELRELYEAMHQAREAERTRMARELHDELAQWLTALKMDVSWLGQRLPSADEKLATRVQKMKQVVDSTVAAVRRIAVALRPVMLDDLGLRPAIEQFLNDLAERGGVDVTLEGSDADADLKEPLATAVYRMLQEALTNVARHQEQRLSRSSSIARPDACGSWFVTMARGCRSIRIGSPMACSEYASGHARWAARPTFILHPKAVRWLRSTCPVEYEVRPAVAA